MSDNLVPLSKKAAIAKLAELGRTDELWEAGELAWKLKGKQVDIYEHFKYNKLDIIPVLISRRFGKSFVMCLLATEVCLEGERHIVKYACPEKGMVADIINPIMEIIIEDCPEHLKPEWTPSEKKWKFPNGSFIQVAGCNGGRYTSLRGGYSQLCIVDEGAFVDELETVVYNVMGPTTDTTDGRIYLATTPNDRDPNHEFHKIFIDPFEASGDLLRMTWEESPMIDDARRAKILTRYAGGINNVKFRCEYLCEVPNVTDTNVIPEFVDKEESIVKEMSTPEYCDFYTSMDLGFKDLTIALFGYYDFNRAALVILDEYVINGPEMTTNVLDREIRLKEKLHFHTSLGDEDAYMRVMDNNNLMLVSELSKDYGLLFVPTRKDKKEAAIDKVRMWIEQERIIIHPRCKNLIYHTKNAQWGTTRAGTYTGKFKNLKGNDAVGLLASHADALDALIYMVRNIHEHRNPYPNNYGKNINENTHISKLYKENNKSEGADFMGKLLNLRKKKKL